MKHLPAFSVFAFAAFTLSALPSAAQQQPEPLPEETAPQEEEQQPMTPDADQEPAPAQQVWDGAPPEDQTAAVPDCSGLPDHGELSSALREVVAPGDPSVNGGLGNHMWAAVVNRQGTVCAIARSGENFGDQWPGSRAIAVAKAHTANAFSLPGFALSTANLYWPSQPESALYGLEASHPSGDAIRQGSAEDWGTERDPLIGQPSGGVTVFGGGLALYTAEGELAGAIGLSGDESCTDHVIAWKVRDALQLDHVPDGVTDASNDNIIHDITDDPSIGRQTSPSGYGHPTCSPAAERIAENFAETHPTGETQ